MVLTPAIRGLFGLEVDELHHRLRLHPKLPAQWDHASLAHVPYGNATVDVTYTRRAGELETTIKSVSPQVLCIDTQSSFNDTDCKEAASTTHVFRIKLPPVEVGLPEENAQQGSRTEGLKVLKEAYGARELTLTLESPAGARKELPLRLNGIQLSAVRVEGGRIDNGRLVVQFPSGNGYVSQSITLLW
jgi:hypothetical protein